MGGRTDMTQLIVIFRNSENAPKKLKNPQKVTWIGIPVPSIL
jgi:hypothetical protein